jgi:hypothetical protein
VYEAWEEGSQLKESLYKIAGGTANTKPPVVAAPTPSRAAGLRANWYCPKVFADAGNSLLMAPTTLMRRKRWLANSVATIRTVSCHCLRPSAQS